MRVIVGLGGVVWIDGRRLVGGGEGHGVQRGLRGGRSVSFERGPRGGTASTVEWRPDVGRRYSFPEQLPQR